MGQEEGAAPDSRGRSQHEQAKTPPAAETHHATTRKRQNTHQQKGDQEKNVTPQKNSHQTNIQEVNEQSYIITGTIALGFTQPLTEMSTGNIKKKLMFLGSKVRLVRGAHNLTTIYEPSV
jgi:hypothetical protein